MTLLFTRLLLLGELKLVVAAQIQRDTLPRGDAAGPARPRPLSEVARENAVEGCARETVSASIAVWQSRNAADPVVAATMAMISTDEVKHAELSWDIARWVEPRLLPAEQVAVVAARAAAFDELLEEAAAPVDSTLIAMAGLPAPRDAVSLVRAASQASV